ncbi:MAG: hypothetical protein ACTSWY_13430 [Promethearchaeota archaeon]
MFDLILWVGIFVIIVITLFLIRIYIKKSPSSNKIELKPPSAYSIYDDSAVYSQIAPRSAKLGKNFELKKLELIKPFPKGSHEGDRAYVWMEMAIESEKLGRVPDSYTYYHYALKNGIPEPFNTQIRKKIGVSPNFAGAKYPGRIDFNTVLGKNEVEKMPALCDKCGTNMIVEEGKLVCPYCGKRYDLK